MSDDAPIFEAGADAALADPSLSPFCHPDLAAWCAAQTPHLAAAAAAAASPAPPSPRLLHPPPAPPLPPLDALSAALAFAVARVLARDGPLPGGLRVRLATPHPSDVAGLYGCVAELAEFEGGLAELSTSRGDFLRDGFGPARAFCALLVEAPVAEGGGGGGGGGWRGFAPAAMALAHPSYSTWRGRTVYLEDLYVLPAFRRHGVAQRLLAVLAMAAWVAGMQRVQWTCLNWNEGAIALYGGRGVGASRLEEWSLWRLEEAELAAASGRPPPEQEADGAASRGKKN